MSLLAPLALLFGLLAIPIIVLYMLKLRRRETPVSSTLLWQKLLRDRQANAPWQRLERSLLLILQLLLLSALVISLARPAVPVNSLASGSVVVILDGSASMNATDVDPNRFEAARQAVHEIIDVLPSEAHLTLVLADPQPRTVVAAIADKNALRRSLDSVHPTHGLADWEGALTLAAGALRSSGEDAALILVSDGGLPAEGLPPVAAEVRFIPVGERSSNLAITAMALRSTGSQVELFTAVSNFSTLPHRAILSFYAGERLFRADTIEVQAGERREFVLSDLEQNGVRYAARLTSTAGSAHPLDDLDLDDSAFAVSRSIQGGRALMVSPGNFFLNQLMQAMPEVQSFRLAPAPDQPLALLAENYDLYIFDGLLPAELPSGNLLLINPPTNSLFRVTGVYTPTGIIPVASHPLAEYVDWGPVHVLKARQVELPAWAELLVGTRAAPLVFTGETGGRRVAVIAFDLLDSDLPLQVAFPILFSSLLEYLLDNQPVQAAVQAGPLQAGAPITLHPPSGVQNMTVILPSGQAIPLEVTENGAVFSGTDELGLYTIRYSGEAHPPDDYFAVNLLNPFESNLEPVSSLRMGRVDITPAASEAVGQRELWPWLASLALGLLVMEWWVYHRRQHIPGESTFERLWTRIRTFRTKENQT